VSPSTVLSALPSLFVRRLLGLGLCLGAIVTLLGMQAVRLTIVEHDRHRSQAERRLQDRRFLPTYRGRIIDRHGRVLAADRAGYDLALEYTFMIGAWSVRRATEIARAEAGARTWASLGPSERQARIDVHLIATDALAERILTTVALATGVPRSELDQRIADNVARIDRAAEATWSRQRELERSRFGDDDLRFVARPIREQREAHAIVLGMPDVVAFELQRVADEYPGTIDVQESTRREYPLLTLEVELDRSRLPRPLRDERPTTVSVRGVADHIIGDMRNMVWPEDIRRRPFVNLATGEIVDLGGYRSTGDRVGARGLERAMESSLRGMRGMVRTRLDIDAQERTEPVPGGDVEVTLDIELQAMVHAIMSPEFGLARIQQWQIGWHPDGTPRNGPLPVGWDLNGSAVVIDVDTGDILAMVSTPTFADGVAMPAHRQASEHPFVHRAVEAPYPPGSIIKPMVYVAGVAEGVLGRTDQIACTGHFFPDRPGIVRCWIYREQFGMATHTGRIGGPLDIEQAMARSCNIYFYTTARRLGPERLVDWYARFGLGHRLSVGLLHERPGVAGAEAGGAAGDAVVLVGEHPGFLPSRDDIEELRRRRDAVTPVILGIGQGPVSWTPVQAANAYATLARGGRLRDATLLKRHTDADLAHRRDESDLRLDARAVELALRGLRASVEEDHGTGSRIRYANGSSDPIVNVDGVIVWAKTGTAQAPRLRLDTTGDGAFDIERDGLDHAWFVGLVGDRVGGRPRYAVAVILEYGGSGGRTAGPVASEIFRAMQRLGYLPGGAGGADGAGGEGGAGVPRRGGTG